MFTKSYERGTHPGLPTRLEARRWSIEKMRTRTRPSPRELTVRHRVQVQRRGLSLAQQNVRESGTHRGVVRAIPTRGESHRDTKPLQRRAEPAVGRHPAPDDDRLRARL